MAYMMDNFNSIRFICIDLLDGSVFKTLTFDGFSFPELKNENKIVPNCNNELLVDSIGERMNIKVILINRTGINTQGNFLHLFDFINKTQKGTHTIKIYPYYDPVYKIETLDSFDCIMDGYYDIDKLHKCLRAGNEYTFKFQERLPNKNYVPKIPYPTTHNFGPRYGNQNNMV